MSENSLRPQKPKSSRANSRRDFLKLSASALAGMALNPIIVQANLFSSVGEAPPDGSIIVDEDNGIGQLSLKGPMQYWWKRDEPSCIGGKMRFTHNTPTPGPVRMNWAIWQTPPLPVAGKYTILVYIPIKNTSTKRATYRIWNGTGSVQAWDGTTNVSTSYPVNQADAKGNWVEIAKDVNYAVGDIGAVYVDDVVPEAPSATWVDIGVDAMVWLPPGVGWNPGASLIPYDPRRAQLGLPTWCGQAGEPVAASLGYFYTQHRDLFVPSPGLSVEFTRAYNSLNIEQGLFGRGWTCMYDMNAQDRGNGEIILTFADGRAGLYIPAGQKYERPKGFFAELEKKGDGWLLTEVDGTRYTFDSRGKPVEIADPNDNKIQIEYAQTGFTITDTVGRTFTVQNNGLGYVKSITDPLGRVFAYEYEGDKLRKFTDAEGGDIQYSYDNKMRMTSITDPNGNTFISNEYDAEGRVILQRDAVGTESTFQYEDKRTTFTDNLGRQTIYEFDSDLRLIKETDHLGRSMIYEYNDNNNQTAVTDREGHKTQMEYDDHGNLKKVIDALSQESTFTYNALNKITHKVDASGAETDYQYDALNFNLKLVTDAEGGKTRMNYFANGLIKNLTNPNNKITRFTYDAYGNLKTVTDALGNVTNYEHDIVSRRTKMTDANGHTVQFNYDGNDRVRVITDPKGSLTKFDYDAVGNLKSSTDRRGNATRYDYNKNDSLVKVTDPRGFISKFGYDLQYHRKTFINRRNYPTRYEYDEVYNLIKVTDAKTKDTRFEYDADHNLVKVIDAKGQITRYEYDELSRLKQVTDTLGGVTKYDYDAVGRVKNRLDPNTAFTQYEYDRLGRLKKVTDALNNVTGFDYDAVGNRQRLTNARGFVTQYSYNAINQLTKQIDPLDHVISWNYDGVGNVLTMTDRRGGKTSFVYDQNDNLIQVTDALNGVASFKYDAEDNRTSATDQNGHTKTFSYDEAGNLLTVRLPLGQITRFGYDANGNQVSVTNAKQNTTSFNYDPLDLLSNRTTPLGNVTGYQYDELRRMVKMVDAEGNPTSYEYDPLGRMIAVIDALNNITRYEYDPVGNMTKHTDANDNPTVFDVDLLGRVKKETNPEASVWSYVYDEVGNRTHRTDANSVLTKYIFDADNRLQTIFYPDGKNVSFDYDPNDNLINVTDRSGSESFVYDPLNRLKRASRTSNILNGKAVEYGYDPVGNRLSVNYPEKGLMKYEYNDNDWLIAAIDPQTAPKKYGYKRDDVGLPTRIDYPNATWADYLYDKDDRLKRLFNGKPETSSNLISSFEYTLDKVGNRRQTIEKLTRGQVVTWTKKYDYDAIYRLRKAVETPDKNPYQVFTSEFEYDAVGNRKKQVTNIADKPNTPALPGPKTTLYSYDRANRLKQAGTTTYTYDANGSRLTMNGSERAIDYTYDFENRLIGAQTYDVLKNKRKADALLDFTYDGLGRRRERGIVEHGVRKIGQYLYDGLGYDMLAQYVDPGSPRTTNYYRDPVQVLSRHETQANGNGNGLQYFHHYDGLGNVSAWTNHVGKATQEYTYAPYGRLIDNNGPDNSSTQTAPHNTLTFSGKMWDKETELYHFGARDYDPAVGVWLTQDPYRGRLKEPMTLHRYGYVGNNPINFVDKYGFDGTSIWQKIRQNTDAVSAALKQVQVPDQIFVPATPYTPAFIIPAKVIVNVIKGTISAFNFVYDHSNKSSNESVSDTKKIVVSNNIINSSQVLRCSNIRTAYSTNSATPKAGGITPELVTAVLEYERTHRDSVDDIADLEGRFIMLYEGVLEDTEVALLNMTLGVANQNFDTISFGAAQMNPDALVDLVNNNYIAKPENWDTDRRDAILGLLLDDKKAPELVKARLTQISDHWRAGGVDISNRPDLLGNLYGIGLEGKQGVHPDIDLDQGDRGEDIEKRVLELQTQSRSSQ